MNESDAEEEIIVYANFEEGTVDEDIFQNPDIKLKIIGLDSDTPVVQLRDSTFKGEWSDAIGTKLLFEEDPSPEQVDPAFTVTPEIMLKYKCQTRKILNFSKIFLRSKPGLIKPTASVGNEENAAVGEENDYSISGKLEEAIQCSMRSDTDTDVFMKDIINNALNEAV